MRVFFSVGEPSGDLHGANLIRELRKAEPGVECVGYGGPKMAAAGCELYEDLTELSFMWLLGVAGNLGKYWSLARRANVCFRHRRPDALVMIDYPGFNWWMAWRAKVYGIPVFYYGTPQLWAWAAWRVRKMRRLVNHALCKLPFEEAWLRQRGCHATYVGHPYFDQLHAQRLDTRFIAEFTDPDRPLVTILPGSRTQEVVDNVESFVRAACLVKSRVPQARFAIAAFDKRRAESAVGFVRQAGFPIEIHIGRTQELMHLATCCMACSGSVSLELLFHEKPTVIHYKISRWAFELQKYGRQGKYITLVNLLAADDPFGPQAANPHDAPFPEYLTWKDESQGMADHVIHWLSDGAALAERQRELARIKQSVAQPGASRRAAAYLLRELSQGAGPRVPRPHFLPADHAETGALSAGVARRQSA
jgi:lipid-A-disaccharide synthase